MTFSPADDLALALKLAGDADLISFDRFQSLDLVVTTKPDRTPVTDADQATERSIRSGIEAARPGDSILGEEFGTEGSGSRQWIIDPITAPPTFSAASRSGARSSPSRSTVCPSSAS